MSYLEVAVSAVPELNRSAYITLAEKTAAVFRRYGAIGVTENWGDDVPEGQHTDFHRAVARENGEAVVVSTILWPSKAVRDAAWPKVMEDPDMTGHNQLFDMSRMIFGGFEQVVDG